MGITLYRKDEALMKNWFEYKIEVDATASKWANERDIWFASIGYNIGSEQDGNFGTSTTG